MKKKLDLYDECVVYYSNMYNHELITLLEKVLNKSYQMKNGVKQHQGEIGIKEILTHMMGWLCHFLKKKVDLYSKLVEYCTNV